jgi:hypothetical protein
MGIERSITSKKLLVALDPNSPDRPSSDFLIPITSDGVPFLFGLRSKCAILFGLVVFTGKSVSVNDLFAKLVDSGRTISSVEAALDTLAAYLAKLGNLKIGQIVEIAVSTNEGGFDLPLSSVTLKPKGSRLP